MDTQRRKDNFFARVAWRATNFLDPHARVAEPACSPGTADYPQQAPAKHDPVPGSPGERALQDVLGSRDRAERFYQEQVSELLTPSMQEFIARMEMVWIATSDTTGRCDCSFRSGPPGFVRVLGDSDLVYPDYRGNGVMASSGNLLENPRIGMWFGDFDQELIGLHVNGRAAVVLPEQMQAAGLDLTEPGHPGRRPTHWVTVSVEEAYVHCRKHLPRLIREPVTRHWGTDSPLRKGGDYFGVAADRSIETDDRRSLEAGGLSDAVFGDAGLADGDLTGGSATMTNFDGAIGTNTPTPGPYWHDRDEPTGAERGAGT